MLNGTLPCPITGSGFVQSHWIPVEVKDNFKYHLALPQHGLWVCAIPVSERVAHIAGSERPGEQPRLPSLPSLLKPAVADNNGHGKVGQSSLLAIGGRISPLTKLN